MKAKMIIVAVIAMGAQFASASAPSTGCQNNASKQTIGNNSQEQATKVVDGLVKVAEVKDVAPAAHGTR